MRLCFYLAKEFFYKFAQYKKPFENETQFVEADQLHDELHELGSALLNNVNADEINSFVMYYNRL